MTRLPLQHALPMIALACALAACSRSESPEPEKPATAKPAPLPVSQAGDGDKAATSAGTRLTIYSGDYDQLADAGQAAGRHTPGFALVDSTLRYTLEAGANAITLAHLPRAIDSASATLHGASGGVRVDGQRFLAPPAGAEAVLSSAIGQRVAVEHTSGGARQVDNGVLVAAGDGLILALGDGRTKVIHEYDNFSLLDGERQPPAEPTLRWQVHSQEAGEHKFEFSYATGGLAWRAEYLARLAPGEDCKLALEGAAMVANRSGVNFRNVALTLVAGEPNRVREDAPQMYRDAAASAPPPVALQSPGVVTPQRSGEYYAYPIPSRTTLAESSIERVPLFPALPGIECERGYLTRPATSTWVPPRPITSPGFNNDTGPQPVTAAVSFSNTREAGLGRPLPAGRVRVFEAGDFLGESQLAHTPEGADIHLDVGIAFDLTAERERRSFRVDTAGRNMTESFAVTVRNAKDTPVKVIVDEPLPRWSDWEVVSSTVPAEKRDAQHVEFELEVPAKGERVLEYTVRYRWPAGMRP